MKFLVLTLFVAAATATAAPMGGGEPVELIVNGVAKGEPLEIGEIVDIQLREHADGEVIAASSLLHPLTVAGLAETAAVEAAAAEAAAAEAAAAEAAAAEAAAAEAAAAEAAAAVPETPIPSPVALPAPALPEVVEAAPVFIPTPVVLPAPVLPEVVAPSPVVLPAPALPEVVDTDYVASPTPVALPAPVLPEVENNPSPVVLPAPAVPEVVESAPVFIPAPVVLPAPVAPEVVDTDPINPSPIATPEVEAAPEVAAQSPNGEIFNDGIVSVTVNVPEEPSMYASLQSWFSMVINFFQNGDQTSQQVV